jgi:hypothetical protein
MSGRSNYMLYTIKKKCFCRAGKMFDVITGKFEKCLHCQGTGIRVIYTSQRCKYCGEPIEKGYFCDACGKAFREDVEEE